MTLLNAMLSLGALAFTIPLTIHLLFRSRFRTVQWGAMHLLDSVVRVNHRRMQWMQILLLLMRCLLPVLLAFCLARPVLTGFKTLPGDAPQSLILAIDDSRSMSALDSSGQTRIHRARQMLQQLVADLSRQDEVILIRSSQLGDSAVATGRSDASDRLRGITADAGPADLARLVRSSLEAATEASHAQRRIVLVSDFQETELGNVTIDSLRRVGDRWGENSAEDSGRPTISFLNVGGNSESLDNVFIDTVSVDSPAVVAGREVRLSAQIQNASDTPNPSLRVTWSVDSLPIQSYDVSVDARQSITVHIDHAFLQRGVRELGVSIEAGDAISADNRRSIAVDVIEDVSVVLVDGAPSNEPMKGDTDFLKVALSPFAFGDVDRADAIRTTVISPEQIEATIRKSPPNVLVLANVARPDKKTKQAVVDFVDHGGSLVLFDGDRIDPVAYNEPWLGKLGSWNLPATLGQIVGTTADNRGDPIAMEHLNQQYGPWRELSAQAGSLIHDVDVFAYRSLTVRSTDSANNANPTLVLLGTTSGDPLIVATTRGRGRVFQFAIPCDDAWSGLPLRTIFVPMMQQLVLDLAGSQRESTINLGQSLSVPIDELHARVDDESSVEYAIDYPNGRSEIVSPDRSVVPPAIIVKPTQPGIYQFRARVRGKDGQPSLSNTKRIVEVTPSESILRDVDSSRLKAAAELVQAQVFVDELSLQSEDQTRRYGREVWRWLLVMLLLLMIGEIVLQQVSVGIYPLRKTVQSPVMPEILR